MYLLFKFNYFFGTFAQILLSFKIKIYCMNAQTVNLKNIVFVSIFDVAALCFIYFVPSLVHLTSIPLYYAEPMRIMLIFSLLYTNKQNAYILAATLPLFSFLVSGHPEALKMGVMTLELMFNLWLYYFLTGKIKNNYLPIFLSIFASKMAYYLLKGILVYFSFLKMDYFSTPVYIQVIMTLVFTGFVFASLKIKETYTKSN
jgi:hypothetical protein